MHITRSKNKNIRAGTGRPSKYLFEDLKPGDVLTIVIDHNDDINRAAIRISTALSAWKRRNNPEWVTAVRKPFKDTVDVHRIA